MGSPVPEPPAFAEFKLTLDTDAPAIICTRCQYALSPDKKAVYRHLRQEHDVPIHLARDKLDHTLDALAVPSPSELLPPADGLPAHPNLAVRPGFLCRRCGFKSISYKNIKVHVNVEHPSEIDHSAQTSQRRFRGMIERDVSLQCWTAAKASCKYWAVKVAKVDKIIAENEITDSPRRVNRVQAIIEAEQLRVSNSSMSDANTDTGLDDFVCKSAWLRRTGWTDLFKGIDRNFLLRLCSQPRATGNRLWLGDHRGRPVYSCASDENMMRRLDQAVERFFERCEDTLRHSDHAVRVWLRSQVPDQPYKAPFELVSREETRAKYLSRWKGLLYFVLRAYRLGAIQQQVHLGMQLYGEQRAAVRRVWDALVVLDAEHPSYEASKAKDEQKGLDDPFSSPLRHRELRRYRNTGPQAPAPPTVAEVSPEESEEDWSSTKGVEFATPDSDSDPDWQEQEQADWNRPDISSTTRLHWANNPFISSSSKTSTDDRRPGSTLATSDQDYLPDLIGELSRFLCEESFRDGRANSALVVFYSSIIGVSADGTTFERPGCYTSKISALIYCVRLCLLESVLPRFQHKNVGWKSRPAIGGLHLLNRIRRQSMCLGCQSPMGELLSLRSYGRALCRSDGPSFRVDWDDDSQVVTWDSGKITMDQFRTLGRLVADAANASLQTLLYGLKPKVELGQIRDRISDTRAGYSFVKDPANGLHDAYIELSRRACLDEAGGLMTAHSWNIAAVRRYLMEEERLLVHLMTLIYLRAGQAPRSTELFSIEHENGPGTSRGVYVHDGALVVVTRHTKARPSTNHEFQVARYLSAQDSKLLFVYLTYVRPFAELLRRASLNFTLPRRLLFSTADNPDQAWGVDVLTRALRSVSEEVCGIRIGVRVYRQVSIAVTEKHIAQLVGKFNRFDDKTAAADITVAFAWQSGHRPSQRGVTYGIDGAFPDSLQPSLLRVYRWSSSQWHRFLQLDGSRAEDESQAGINAAKQLDTNDDGQETLASQRSTFVGVVVPCKKRGVFDDALEDADRSPLKKPKVEEAAELCFRFHTTLRLLICRECQYCVWPQDIDSHLKNKRHQLDVQTRRLVKDSVDRLWPSLLREPDMLKLPSQLEETEEGLILFTDGLQCTVDVKICNFVARSAETLRKHVARVHQEVKEQGNRNSFFLGVRCQRYFPSRQGSSYIPIVNKKNV